MGGILAHGEGDPLSMHVCKKKCVQGMRDRVVWGKQNTVVEDVAEKGPIT